MTRTDGWAPGVQDSLGSRKICFFFYLVSRGSIGVNPTFESLNEGQYVGLTRREKGMTCSLRQGRLEVLSGGRWASGWGKGRVRKMGMRKRKKVRTISGLSWGRGQRLAPELSESPTSPHLALFEAPGETSRSLVGAKHRLGCIEKLAGIFDRAPGGGRDSSHGKESVCWPEVPSRMGLPPHWAKFEMLEMLEMQGATWSRHRAGWINLHHASRAATEGKCLHPGRVGEQIKWLARVFAGPRRNRSNHHRHQRRMEDALYARPARFWNAPLEDSALSVPPPAGRGRRKSKGLVFFFPAHLP